MHFGALFSSTSKWNTTRLPHIYSWNIEVCPCWIGEQDDDIRWWSLLLSSWKMVLSITWFQLINPPWYLNLNITITLVFKLEDWPKFWYNRIIHKVPQRGTRPWIYPSLRKLCIKSSKFIVHWSLFWKSSKTLGISSFYISNFERIFRSKLGYMCMGPAILNP